MVDSISFRTGIILTIIAICLIGGFLIFLVRCLYLLHSILIASVFNHQQFAWTEIDRIDYEYEIGLPGTYTFYSGENLASITETGQFTSSVTSKITKLAKEYDIPFEKQEKSEITKAITKSQ
ncbi:hypothetical protein [Ureibacillus aquaedulcis]|uniref:DUF4907 domain-containing protein n=1 Tax=Ureibacillus aquaedulcis TaxID=3058421 RepID=A0ABT8GTG9_9BACL|nr:hypothetical protein [Ureibacillus sp. BA0131]MDN4494674.1 hypothetical protein [Ureibacillus sp. BA0131]